MLREYQDTLRRLLKGDFQDLSRIERQAKVDQIISLSASAAMALAATPVPFLDLPVLLGMVRAIAKVRGVVHPGKRVMLHLIAALGGGLFIRQALRFIPIGGPLPLLSRVYGATWALGRAADLYFAGNQEADPEDLRREFRLTLEHKTEEEARRMEAVEFEEKLAALKALREKELITEAEYQAKRKALLALL